MSAIQTRTEKRIRATAERLLAAGADAMAFSERFFGSQGLLRQLWETETERREVMRSDLYRWLHERLSRLHRAEVEAFEKEVEALSGRLTITVPKSLHASLKREASREGVSLSELIRLKLTLPYRVSVAR